MPKQKDLKRLVRARMQKTGESYTTARSRILEKGLPPARPFAALAGMSDAAVRAKTDRTWRQWVAALDRIDAATMTHREIARHVRASYGLSSWWSQTVTVGYERIRGLREIGQRRGGTFEANKSRTFPVPVSTLYRAFSLKRRRARWLPDVDPTIRTSRVDKSMRIGWPDGTSVQAYFTAKGPEKSQVAIQHGGLASGKEMARRKEYWTERLAALGEVLAGGS